MYKYLEKLISLINLSNIDDDEIMNFRNDVIYNMKKYGANNDQINLLDDVAIKYAILNKRNPKDLAWALLQ